MCEARPVDRTWDHFKNRTYWNWSDSVEEQLKPGGLLHDRESLSQYDRRALAEENDECEPRVTGCPDPSRRSPRTREKRSAEPA